MGERIRVGVVFREEGISICPRWFRWRGRKMPVHAVTYRWCERAGKDVIHHFVVTDGSDLYELSYRQERLMWFLEAVETDG